MKTIINFFKNLFGKKSTVQTQPVVEPIITNTVKPNYGHTPKECVDCVVTGSK